MDSYDAQILITSLRHYTASVPDDGNRYLLALYRPLLYRQ